ncbi:hypothetical protein VNO78_24111 [Psophocarpus tetragonolobus]|uniref:Uncharacterized protein n=1 Tax=Psophocarpus tetragonolobus TaxID=3891 RepID=A0AAN9XE70_PSOTE
MLGISVHNSTSSPSLLVFFVINSIIFAILVGNHKPSLAEVDKASPLLPSFFEGEIQSDFLENPTYDKVYESDVGYCKSPFNIKDESADNVDVTTYEKVDESDDDDGYCKTPDNIVVYEITTQEQQESDDNLQTRIESFIAKVYKGWIEENNWDKYGIDI